MVLQTVLFCCLLFAALALAPSVAHLLELPNKIHLPAEDYLRVQQIYRGWALLGIVVIAALLSTFILAIMVRTRPTEFAYAATALASIAITQLIFWTFTFPVNKHTQNWTTLPPNWLALRTRWEYSHATSAVFNLIALVAVILAILAAIPSSTSYWTSPSALTGEDLPVIMI